MPEGSAEKTGERDFSHGSHHHPRLILLLVYGMMSIEAYRRKGDVEN